MTVVDLSTISEALRIAIREGVAASAAWAPNPPPTVELYSPEHMVGEGLTMYLFAVGQASIIGNQPGNPADLPLGLELQYQLCAHAAINPATNASAQRQQRLLGLAMKVLHETPRLQAGTTVAGIDLFGAAGIADENSMAIELQPIAGDQTFAFWNATQPGPVAAAYYAVSVVQLQERPGPTSGPPVLVREVFGFASMAPSITGTASRVTLAQPGQPPQTVLLAPAQVTPGGTFELRGSGFTGDLTVMVELDSGPQPLPGASVRTADGTEVLTTSIDRRLGGRAVLPGLVPVWVSRTVERSTSTGETVRFTTDSNQTAIQVVPSVDAVVQPGGPGTPCQITGGPFSDPGRPSMNVRVLLGVDELTSVAGVPGQGAFTIVGPDTIELLPAQPLTEPTRLRIIVDGAENPPHWMVAP